MPNKKIFEKIAAIFWWLPFSTAFDTPCRRRNPLRLRPPHRERVEPMEWEQTRAAARAEWRGTGG